MMRMIIEGTVSRGRITSDKNKNSAPTETDASDAVSCELNIEPMIIPMELQSEATKKSITRVSKIVKSICEEKKSPATVRITITCMRSTVRLVMNVEKMKVTSLVGVMKFLNDAFEFFSN